MLTDITLNPQIEYAPLLDESNVKYDAHRYSQLGGLDMGYPRTTATATVWTLSFDLGQRRFYIQSNTGISYNFLSVPDNIQVTQITYTFDKDWNIVWSYSYINLLTDTSHVYLGRYVHNADIPITPIITIDNVTSPTLMVDVERSVGVSKFPASILLLYSPLETSKIMLRGSDDGFLNEREVASLRDNEFIVESGMAVGRRMKVVTREAVGKVTYKALLTASGGLLLDRNGNPLWVSHQHRT